MSHKLLKTMDPYLSKEQLQTLCSVAIQAAQEAGRWIEKFKHHNPTPLFKDAGSSKASQIVTEADIGSEDIIRKRLQNISNPLSSKPFNIAFVGEESSNMLGNSNERLVKPHFWCVDPLDGTLPFTQGRAGYAVSIALVEQSGEPVIGVVYDPSTQVLHHAIKGQGCYRNLIAFKQTKQIPTTLTVYADTSFKTHDKYTTAVSALEQCARSLNMNGVTFNYGNGAVKNACHVLESNKACYLKLPKEEEGGGSIWDYAATACIAQESGAWVSSRYGHPLTLNAQGSTFMNRQGIVFASNQQIAQHLIDALD